MVNSLCGGEVFFNLTALLNSTDPDLSLCFEQMVLKLIPCAYFFILAIPFYFNRNHSYHSHIPVSKLFRARLMFTVVIGLSSFAGILLTLYEYTKANPAPLSYFLSPLIVCITMVFVGIFLEFERKKGFLTSGFLSFFWIICLLMYSIQLKSKIEFLVHTERLPQKKLLYTVAFMTSYVGIVANFLLSFMVDGPRAELSKDPFLKKEEQNDYLVKYSEEKPKLSPENFSCYLSQLTKHWFNGLVWFGYKHPLTIKDLWALSDENKAAKQFRRFLKTWEEEVAKSRHRSNEFDAGRLNEGYEDEAELPHEIDDDEQRLLDNYLPRMYNTGNKQVKKPSLFRAIWKTYLPDVMVTVYLQIIFNFLWFTEPQLLKALINFTGSDMPKWYGFMLAILMFANACVMDMVEQQRQYVCNITGMRIRSALINAVYRKALVLSNSSRKCKTSGEIVNLMAIDARAVSDVVHWLNLLWSGPMQATMGFLMLYYQLGLSTLSGVGLLVLLIPANFVFWRRLFDYNKEKMKLKDERMKMMNEVLHGIKLLKMYAWELSFKEKVEKIRNLELAMLRKTFNVRTFVRTMFMTTPTFVALISFAVYVMSDASHVLNAEKAFVSLSLFWMLFWPIHLLPISVPVFVDAKVSLNRLSDFLCSDELNPSDVIRSEECNEECIHPVLIKDGKFTWNREEKAFLEEINMTVKRGELVAVVGQVGCGKSSLLSAMLGDMEKVQGNVHVLGSTAYIPQQAWIQNTSAKNNILFGKELDEGRYEKTVKMCELTEDFQMLPAGDQTEIGERGINLSGGQKQRLSLARAVYQDLEIYLLDDPLSAVDAHVGKGIFDNVLGPNGILKHKTRVLVTHGVAFLPQVDKIIVMKNGRISEVGSYEQLQASNGDFSEFLATHAEGLGTEENDENIEADGESSTGSNVRNRSRSKAKDKEGEEEAKSKNNNDKMIGDEDVETGKVDKKNYWLYLKSFGLTLALFSSCAEISYQVLNSLLSLWLSAWSNDPIDPVTGHQNSTTYRLLVYGGIGVGQGLFALAGTMMVFHGAIVGGRAVHNRMLLRILRAPMSFYDTTPLGRILNRFSKDVGNVDQDVPVILREMVCNVAEIICVIVGISYTTYKFLYFMLPISVIYYFIQRIFIPTSRQIRRLESISRSPVYSHFEESLLGVSTIRAYNLKENFSRQNEERIDTMTRVVYVQTCAFRWLALRLTVVGSFIVLAAATLSVLEQGTLSGGLVGLSVSFALRTTGIMNAIVRLLTEMENQVVAVERVEEYSSINQEAPLQIESKPVDKSWPQQGKLVFSKYATKYRPELDLVVQDIDLVIEGGEKIGVVGRTGAGKSSLTLALFRIIESSHGSIIIDDIDISNIGLHDLRSKIAIIPQDPILFAGSLRMNLDPFDVYTDDELWDALAHSHLKTFVSSTTNKLEHQVSEGGENLSVGQRQLVCLARALLKKSKILVLDEATAAVDLETDSLIQTTIREQFASCTIFTIAHRLNTIMDSDRIAVMDAGRLIQLASPEQLLAVEDGVFYGMAKDAGLLSPPNQ